MSGSIKVWDAPLRLFHWLFAGSVSGAIATGWLGGNLMIWHGRLGLLVFGLLVFRLLWGVCGSTYARWSRIVSAPLDRKSTRLNSSHVKISYAVFCLKKKTYYYQNRQIMFL